MRVAPVAAVAVLLAGCGAAPIGPPEPSKPVPPDGPALDVVGFYLDAVRARDCAQAARVAAPTFRIGNGELCGVLTLSDFAVKPQPARPSPLEAVFGVSMVTSGSVDGSIPAGQTTWFLDLQRRGDGRWLLVGGGSGP